MHADVRYWPLADIARCTAHVRFRGKADITSLMHRWVSLPPAAQRKVRAY